MLVSAKSIDKILLFLPKFLLLRQIRGGNRLARFLARNWRELQTYRVDAIGGSLFVDFRNSGTHAFLSGTTPRTDEHSIMARCVNAGDVAYDIGANIGVYTVWLSNLVGPRGKVFSFEPNPGQQLCLAKSISLLGNTDLLPVGLADREGSFEFFVPEDDTMASLRDWTHGDGGKVSTTNCQVTTIDGLVAAGAIERADFIKCDIEGGELDCFEGARTLLNNSDAPIILFEANVNSTFGYGNNISSGMDLLRSLDNARFSFFLLQEDGELERIESVDFDHGNILAVPESRMERISAQLA